MQPKPDAPLPPPPRTVRECQPDKRVPPPTVEFSTGLGRSSYLMRENKVLSSPTYRIRFRRGWFGRLVVQVEWVVKVYESRYPSAKVKREQREWRDATRNVRAEIARGYFTPESHQVGAKK